MAVAQLAIQPLSTIDGVAGDAHSRSLIDEDVTVAAAEHVG